MIFETRLGVVSLTPAATYRHHENLTVLCMAGTAATAKTDCPIGSRFFALTVAVENAAGTIFYVRDGQQPQTLEPGQPMTFTVPVKWNGVVPQTRDNKSNLDCADVVIITPDGRFVDVEIALITRKGTFYLSAQRVYEGQMVRTRREGKIVTEFVPGRAIHAYPGSDFSKVWSGLADCVLQTAPDEATIQKSRAYAPKWTPPSLPDTNGSGWEPGVARYFNLVSGTGEVEGRGGELYFVHFKNVLAPEGSDGVQEMPALTPMTVVLFHPDAPNEHDRRPLRSIRAIKPFLTQEPAD